MAKHCQSEAMAAIYQALADAYAKRADRAMEALMHPATNLAAVECKDETVARAGTETQ